MDAHPIRRPLTHPRQHYWFAAGLLLFFVAISVQYSFKVRVGDRDNRSAFLRWREQIIDLLERDVNIWERHNYPNPPVMVALLEPLVYLPPLAGSLCWFYLKVGMAALALFGTFRLVEDPDRPFPAWGKALVVLLALRPITGDLSHGNINLFILALVVGALCAFRGRRELLAGVLLALGIACKVTPALFVPYFVWKRAWKTLASCALGLVLFYFLVPGARWGMARNVEFLGSWAERMIRPFVVEGVVTTEHPNQSLPGLLYRMATHSPSFVTYIDNQYTPVEYHNLVALDPDTVKWLVKGCMGLFALAVVWVCRTPTDRRAGWRLAAEFSLVVLGMLLFSERTWKHHCVTLLLPFGVLAYYLSVCRPGPWLRAYLIGTLAAVVLLMSTTSTGLLEALDRAAKLAQVYGAYVWSYLLLMAALVVLLKRGEPAAAAPPAGEAGERRPARAEVPVEV
jgi:alpha-1,2-mannosyltransferase